MKTCGECNEKEKAPGRSRCYSCYGRYRRGSARPILTNPSSMKMLFIDIETRPNMGYFWDIFNENIGINQIKDAAEVFCFAAKWYGSDEMLYYSGYGSEDNKQAMVEAAWQLLDEADVVVHFYGKKFDVPHLNREFLQNGLPPPSPFKQIDLKMVCSQRFKFTSNKLQFVSTQLGLEGKDEHEGFPLWAKCMLGDTEAWKRMEAYNKQDVILLEEVYEIMLPWIPSHPTRWLYDGYSGCPNCGFKNTVLAHGYAYTRVSRYQQYRCTNCGSVFRDSKRLDGVTMQESVL